MTKQTLCELMNKLPSTFLNNKFSVSSPFWCWEESIDQLGKLFTHFFKSKSRDRTSWDPPEMSLFLHDHNLSRNHSLFFEWVQIGTNHRRIVLVKVNTINGFLAENNRFSLVLKSTSSQATIRFQRLFVRSVRGQWRQLRWRRWWWIPSSIQLHTEKHCSWSWLDSLRHHHRPEESGASLHQVYASSSTKGFLRNWNSRFAWCFCSNWSSS